MISVFIPELHRPRLLVGFIVGMFFCLLTSYACADIVTGLLGRWKLDDGNGSNIVDSSGNGKNGTLSGSPAWISVCRIGQCLSFNGTSSYGAVPPLVPLGANPKSINTWFKTVQTSYPDGAAFLIGQGSVQAGLTNFILYISPAGKLESSPGSGLNKITTANVVNNAVWHMATLTYDGVARKMYLDGLFVGQYTETEITDIGANNKFDIASYQGRASSNCYFDGLIDDVRIYNRALTAGDVQELYNYKYNVRLRGAHLRGFKVR